MGKVVKRLFTVGAVFLLAIVTACDGGGGGGSQTDIVDPIDPIHPIDPGQSSRILISVEEVANLPVSGPAWDNLLLSAQRSANHPGLSDGEDDTDIVVLAKALVYARTGEDFYRQEVITACMDAIGTQGGSILYLARELAAYVLAADIVGLPPDENELFSAFLDEVRYEQIGSRTLISTHEERPNNWGTHAGASRIAVALYLGDDADLERAAKIFKGWLGDRDSYAGFNYGDLSWQCTPGAPVGINPTGCTIEGHNVDGVLPDDQRRGGSFQFPPPQENYVYEALQGVLLQAIMLERAGYDVWSWEDQAILRAMRWLHEEADFEAEGDDEWQPHVVNHFYGTEFPAVEGARSGKSLGFTDWLYSN